MWCSIKGTECAVSLCVYLMNRVMQKGMKPALFVGRDIVFAQVHNRDALGGLFCSEAGNKEDTAGNYCLFVWFCRFVC